MMRPLSYSAPWLTVTLLMTTACQGEAPEEQQEATPSPKPAAELETTSLPDSPGKLAELATERMQEALSVEVEISVEPEDEETESIEDVSMTLLLTDPPAARMTVVDHDEERPSTAHIVVEDEVMYTKLEEEPLLEDKEWMRVSEEEITSAEEEIGPFAEVFKVMLRETNKSLDEASGESSLDVVRLGELSGEPETEESDGGELTRYRGTTSTHELVDAEHEEFEQAADQGLDEVSWEIAVSDRGLPSEFSVELLTPDGERAESTVHYSDWGADVEISKPPEDNTGTIQEGLGS